MAKKIMLVEDDTNLSEIYQARLQAEGFEIISAKDGEEALALAVNEHPDLILCDVMMPRISGFDMLDILRGTAGIQDTKVVMMTALNQAEDKARAEKLGADRYLVKSQVTLEDVVKTVHEVLEDKPEEATPPVVDKPSLPADAPKNDPPTEPPVAADPVPEPTTTSPTDLSADQTTNTEQTAVQSQIQNFVDDSDKKDDDTEQKPEDASSSPPDSGHSMNKVVEPTAPPEQTDIKDLVEAEDKKDENTGPQFDDKAPEPEQNPTTVAEPSKSSTPEPDPNQIAL